MYNDTGAALTWIGDDAKSEDSWHTNPPRTLRSNPSREPTFPGWLTVSSWARGCWNNVRYQNRFGTVEIGVSDPYSDPNNWLCRTTGTLRCLRPEHKVSDYLGRGKKGSFMRYASTLGGAHLAVAYCIVRSDVPLARSTCEEDPDRE